MSAPSQVPAEPVAHPSLPGSAPAAAVRASSRKLSFDVLRVVFVLLVVLYHSTFIGPLVYPETFVPRRLVFAHQVGASLLLVLSAYFVAVTIGKGDTVRWWWGKMARLVPPFAVATVLAWTFLRYLAPGGLYYPSKHDLVANLLMLWNWNGHWHWDYVDGSYWTIPLQLMGFTLAALIWRHSPWLRHGVGIRVLMWVGLLVPLAQLPYHLSLPGDSVYGSVVGGLGLHRWHLFVAGLAIWMVATRRIGKLHFAALLTGCVVAHAAHTGWLNGDGTFGFDHWAVVGIALGMVALLAAAAGPDWTRWVPGRVARVITWLAAISYGVFLEHQTVGFVVMSRLQMLGVGPSLQTVAMILSAVFCGWLLTRFVERPAHQHLMASWDRVTARVSSRRAQDVRARGVRVQGDRAQGVAVGPDGADPTDESDPIDASDALAPTAPIPTRS